MTTGAQLGLRFLIGLGVLAVGPVVAFDLLRQGGVVAALAPHEHVEHSMLGFVLACAGVVAFAFVLRPGLSWLPLRPGHVVVRYGGFVLLWAPLLLGYLALLRATGIAIAPQPALPYLADADFARPGFWCVVVGTCVAAPLAEEVVFRGYLQPALLASMSPRAAIAITAAAFGLVHTLPYALPVALLGAFFGWLAWRCGSLWPAVLAHMLHNVTTVVLTVCWPGSLDLLYPR